MDNKVLNANNYITAINDINDKAGFDSYITYVYIDVNGVSGYTVVNNDLNTLVQIGNMNRFSSMGYKNQQKFLIDAEIPEEIVLKKNSYTITPLKGPKYNIYDKYSEVSPTPVDTLITQPLARVLDINETVDNDDTIYHGETISTTKSIFRFNGPYEPIFKDIDLFNRYYYYYSLGTYELCELPGVCTDEYNYSLDGSKTNKSIVPSDITDELIWQGEPSVFLTDNTNYPEILDAIEQSRTLVLNAVPSSRTVGGVVVKNRTTPTFGNVTKWVLSTLKYGTTCVDNYVESLSIGVGQKTGLLLFYDFGFNLPNDAIIKGVKVTMDKMSSFKQTNESIVLNGVYDYSVRLFLDDVFIGDNKAKLYDSTNVDTIDNVWESSFVESVYGDSVDLWNYELTPSVINDTHFGICIDVKSAIPNVAAARTVGEGTVVRGNTNTSKARIKCVNVCVTYEIPSLVGKNTLSTFERNLRFNERLEKFGIVEELLYSKVNHEENVLKLKTTNDDKSQYPMVDEYGYNYSERFIFKSTWDSDFYIKTKNELE